MATIYIQFIIRNRRKKNKKIYIFYKLYYEYVYNSCTNDVIMCNSIQQVVTTEFTKINLLKWIRLWIKNQKKNMKVLFINLKNLNI